MYALYLLRRLVRLGSRGVLLLLRSCSLLRGSFSLGRGPQGLQSISVMTDTSRGEMTAYQVVSEELHDQGGVLVALLAQGVELCDDISVKVHSRRLVR